MIQKMRMFISSYVMFVFFAPYRKTSTQHLNISLALYPIFIFLCLNSVFAVEMGMKEKNLG